jgi:hypothetical protein
LQGAEQRVPDLGQRTHEAAVEARADAGRRKFGADAFLRDDQ